MVDSSDDDGTYQPIVDNSTPAPDDEPEPATEPEVGDGTEPTAGDPEPVADETPDYTDDTPPTTDTNGADPAGNDGVTETDMEEPVADPSTTSESDEANDVNNTDDAEMVDADEAYQDGDVEAANDNTGSSATSALKREFIGAYLASAWKQSTAETVTSPSGATTRGSLAAASAKTSESSLKSLMKTIDLDEERAIKTATAAAEVLRLQNVLSILSDKGAAALDLLRDQNEDADAAGEPSGKTDAAVAYKQF